MGIVKTGILSAVVVASTMFFNAKPADAQFYLELGSRGRHYSPAYHYGPTYRPYYGPTYHHQAHSWDRRDFRRAERRAERQHRRFIRKMERRFDWDD